MEAVPSAYAQAVQVREPSVSLAQVAQVCDPFLACDTALTCIDGELFPHCGDDNCDTPIDVCGLVSDDSLGCTVCEPGIQFDTGEMVGSDPSPSPYHCRAACQDHPATVRGCAERDSYGEGSRPYRGPSVAAQAAPLGLGLGLEPGEASPRANRSPFGGAYRLDMQSDGNLVLYDDSATYMGWSTLACDASSAPGAPHVSE